MKHYSTNIGKLTRKECIDAAVSARALGNIIGVRNAARSLADYCRVVLGNVGHYYSGYGVIQFLAIKPRYIYLSSFEPKLLPFKKLFYEIQDLRDATEHDDSVVPKEQSLENLIQRIKELDNLIENKIIPGLFRSGKTPKEKFSEEWKAVLALYDGICDYPSSIMGDFKAITSKVDEFKTIESNLLNMSDEVIHEARLKLSQLQNDLRIMFENADRLEQELISEHEFDRLRGK